MPCARRGAPARRGAARPRGRARRAVRPRRHRVRAAHAAAGHPNAMTLEAWASPDDGPARPAAVAGVRETGASSVAPLAAGTDAGLLARETYYSVGGGFIRREGDEPSPAATARARTRSTSRAPRSCSRSATSAASRSPRPRASTRSRGAPTRRSPRGSMPSGTPWPRASRRASRPAACCPGCWASSAVRPRSARSSRPPRPTAAASCRGSGWAPSRSPSTKRTPRAAGS